MSFLRHLLPGWKKQMDNKQRANAAILDALDRELKEAEQASIESRALMTLSTSSGPWLDQYGKLFGVIRKDNESDLSYRTRIINYMKLQRGTIPAIKDAIREFLQDYDTYIEVYEPYTNVFTLNRSKLNGTDHFLGSYYTVAVIDIRISRPFPVAIIDIINEFKPAGVTVHVTYRPVGEILDMGDEIEGSKKVSIANGVYNWVRGGLNINLASFSTADRTYSENVTLTNIRSNTTEMTADFYTATKTNSGQFAAKTLNKEDRNFLYFTIDAATTLKNNYVTGLKHLEPSGVYNKSVYNELLDNPQINYSLKSGTAASDAIPFDLQLYNFQSGQWVTVDTGYIQSDMFNGTVRVNALENYLSNTGLCLSRISVDSFYGPPVYDGESFTSFGNGYPEETFDGGSFSSTDTQESFDAGSLSSPSSYDLQLHFFELAFNKELVVHPAAAAGVQEITSYATLIETTIYDGAGSGDWTVLEADVDGGELYAALEDETLDGGYF